MPLSAFFLIAFALFALMPPAYAQKISGNFNGGSIKIGYDNAACDSGRSGAIRYLSSNKKLQMCNGTDWVALSAPGNPEYGKPLFARTIVYAGTGDNTVFNAYNNFMDAAIVAYFQPVAEPDRTSLIATHRNECKIINPAVTEEKNHHIGCGRIICMALIGTHPYSAEIGNRCIQGDITTCNNGNFYISWNCMTAE